MIGMGKKTPNLLAQPQPQSLDPFSQSVMIFSASPYLAGACYIIMNLAGKHVSFNLSPEQEKFFGSEWFRPIIIFALCFVGTRNVITASWLALFFVLVFYVVLHESSPFSLMRMIPVTAEIATKAPGGTQSMFAKQPIAVEDLDGIAKEEKAYEDNIKIL